MSAVCHFVFPARCSMRYIGPFPYRVPKNRLYSPCGFSISYAWTPISARCDRCFLFLLLWMSLMPCFCCSIAIPEEAASPALKNGKAEQMECFPLSFCLTVHRFRVNGALFPNRRCTASEPTVHCFRTNGALLSSKNAYLSNIPVFPAFFCALYTLCMHLYFLLRPL